MKYKLLLGMTLTILSSHSLACTPSGSWGFDGPRLVQKNNQYEYTVKVPTHDVFSREKIEIYLDGQLMKTKKSIPIKQTSDFTLNFTNLGNSKIEVSKVSDFSCGAINVSVAPNIKSNVKIEKRKVESKTYENGISYTRWLFDVSELGAYSYQPGDIELKWYVPTQTLRNGRRVIDYKYAGSGRQLDFTGEKFNGSDNYWVKLIFTYRESGEVIKETLGSSYYVESDIWCDPHGLEACQIIP